MQKEFDDLPTRFNPGTNKFEPVLPLQKGSKKSSAVVADKKALFSIALIGIVVMIAIIIKIITN